MGKHSNDTKIDTVFLWKLIANGGMCGTWKCSNCPIFDVIHLGKYGIKVDYDWCTTDSVIDIAVKLIKLDNSLTNALIGEDL